MHPIRIIKLSEMRPGEKGAIVAFNGGHEFLARITSMGLHIGGEVSVLRRAVGRGPVLVGSGSTRIALGRGMSEKIVVEAAGGVDSE